MNRCQFCNSALEEGARYCTQCGKEQKETNINELNKSLIRQQINQVKTKSELYVVLKQNPSLMEEPELAELFGQAENSLERKEKDIVTRRHSASGKELWTWIRAGNNSAVLYDNKSNPDVEKDDFMDLLQKKIKDNGVPVSLHKHNVIWDGGKTSTEEFMVQIQEHTLENPFSLLINFTKIGKFTFVRENMFITPPELPQAPSREVPNGSGVLPLILGFIIMILGESMSGYGSSGTGSLLGLLFMAIGGGIEFYKYYIKNQWKSWTAAWDLWKERNVEYTFQQVVNGKLDCIQLGISKSIQEVCEELYPQAMLSEEHSKVDQVDLEEAIAKKKKSLE